ncbi:uncharacterized protein DUF4185 [Paenibacillus taihuensis]|uniref:Uncharacterized protein DUF4185 n=1 Tax=Paenibacillus taihuensis TaxID=1156355 RepID=A0A3D9R597_9BACL|nr:DUF4185 domain-containing protein [Paenibacillus taihuensis]REE69589.1 uncharacterized protein DUF4185 [Paenibacillus taihuensis]
MYQKKKALYLLGAAVMVASTCFSGTAGAITPSGTVKIARVTGATPAGETIPNPNQTASNYQVEGTDLGIMWDKGGGEIFALFGDTFGPGWSGNGGGGSGWRSNVLAKSSDTNLADGLTFSTMIQDTPGHAKELLASKKIDNDEMTVIPTAGVTIGTRHYIHYMSVRHWGNAGQWITNYSGLAYSDDNGQNWTKSSTAKWMNNASYSDNFQMGAFVKDGGFVYMYSTPNGRFGNVYLSRVPQNNMLNIGDWRYWDGNGWVADRGLASPVAVGSAGELSVVYNTFYNRFIMTYLNEDRQAVVMRDAGSLTGPWSGEKILAKGADFPGLYNAFIHPWSTNSSDMYFVMSQWTPYNTFLMKATLNADSFGDNLVSEPGFETQDATPVMAPWYTTGNGGIDRNLGSAHSGQDNGFVRNNTGWNALIQKIAVQPNTNYTLTGWIKTSANNNDGLFGARVPGGGPIMGETHFTSLGTYTQLTVNFNSGNNSFAEIYCGLWATADMWIQMDDVSLTKTNNAVSQAGFENQPTNSLTSPWYADGNAGVDHGLGFAHSGANNSWVRNTSGWNAVKQEISVVPNTSYTLTGWVKTSTNMNNGYFGARAIGGGPVLNEVHMTTPLGSYTQQTVTFNSGNNHSVEIYAGLWADGDTWLQADDFSVAKN